MEPSDLDHTDGRRADRVKIIPWKNGKPTELDASCPDTLAQSYHCHSTTIAGAVADLAEERKLAKDVTLWPGYPFIPAVIRVTEPIG